MDRVKDKQDKTAKRTAAALEQIAAGFVGNPEIVEALRQRAFRLRHLNEIFGSHRAD